MDLEVLVEAYCPTKEDVIDLENNFYENYSYFFDSVEEYSYDNDNGNVRILWDGKASSNFDETYKNEFIRLTHHAEGLYEGTNIEHTHVEVAIDDKWYGRG